MPEQGVEPRPWRCRCSALPVELSGQLGAENILCFTLGAENNDSSQEGQHHRSESWLSGGIPRTRKTGDHHLHCANQQRVLAG